MNNLPAGPETYPDSPAGKMEFAVDLSGFELDPEEAARRKATRVERLHTVTFPTFRFLGFAALSLAVYVYLRFFEQQADALLVTAIYAAVALVYCLASLWVLRTFYKRLPGPRLGLAFLTLDMVVQTFAIYVTGGETSWLVAMLLLRVADQTTFGRRRSLFFAHCGALCFFGLIVYLGFGEGRPLDWTRELAKTALLYGAGVWIAMSASPADRRRRQVSAAFDATRGMILELEAAAHRLDEAKIHAEAANLAKSQFLANMTHELRTPLTAIVGIADLLEQEDLQPDQHEWVGLLQTSADSLLRLVNDILDFSKIEAGKLSVDAELCRLEAVVEDTVRLLAPKALTKKVDLRCILPTEAEPAIADPARLRQVLLNLVGNAVKFTSQGSVEVRLSVVEGGGERRARFEVEDTGIGITEEQQRSLFEPFTQADASYTRRYGGTGLGLSIARRLLDLMAGTIGVESRLGEGSTFWFEIPWRRPDAEDLAPPEAKAEVQTETTVPLADRIRVLLVEDNALNRVMVEAMLASLGVMVESAEDGREAVAAVARKSFDLVLMDCQMPVMDGYQATREIRRQERPGVRRLPIVALSAHALAGERQRCLEAGMDEHLSKPVHLETLSKLLATYCPGPTPGGDSC